MILNKFQNIIVTSNNNNDYIQYVYINELEKDQIASYLSFIY